MSGAQGKLAAVTVGDAHELRSVGVPAAGLVPELGGREDGHHHLLGADALHLVADDGLDLGDRAPCERQVAIEAGGGLANHAGAQEQAVARKLGLGRVLLQRGGVELGHLLIALHVRSFQSAVQRSRFYDKRTGRASEAATLTTPSQIHVLPPRQALSSRSPSREPNGWFWATSLMRMRGERPSRPRRVTVNWANVVRDLLKNRFLDNKSPST